MNGQGPLASLVREGQVRLEDPFDILVFACETDDRESAGQLIRRCARWEPPHPLLPVSAWTDEQTSWISPVWVRDLMQVTMELGEEGDPGQPRDRTYYDRFAGAFLGRKLLINPFRDGEPPLV